MAQTITEINPDTGAASTFATAPGEPWGLTAGPDGRFYVACGRYPDSGPADLVEVVGPDGGQAQQFNVGGSMMGPNDLVFDQDGKLFVVSYYDSKVSEFDGTTGEFIASFQPYGNTEGTAGITARADGGIAGYRGTTNRSGGAETPSAVLSGQSADPRSVPTLPLPGVVRSLPVAPAAEVVFSPPGITPSAVLTPSAALLSHDTFVLAPNVSAAFRPPTAGTELWGPLDRPDPARGDTQEFLPEPHPLHPKDVLFAWLGGSSDPVDLRGSTWDDPATL